MINTRLAVAIHILVLIASKPNVQLSSDIIASSVTTNPAVIRRISSELNKAGIVTSRVGVPGFTLTRDPKEISFLDIYKGILIEKDLFSNP